jgi:hypothetical protein
MPTPFAIAPAAWQSSPQSAASLDSHRNRYNADNVSFRNVELVAVSVVEFKRAELLQDAKVSGITIEDVARDWLLLQVSRPYRISTPD